MAASFTVLTVWSQCAFWFAQGFQFHKAPLDVVAQPWLTVVEQKIHDVASGVEARIVGAKNGPATLSIASSTASTDEDRQGSPASDATKAVELHAQSVAASLQSPQICSDFVTNSTVVGCATAGAALNCVWNGPNASSGTCSSTSGRVECNKSHTLSIEGRTEAYSNLAGLGPDNNETLGMKILNVFPDFERQIDIQIKVDGGIYAPRNVTQNEEHGMFGNLNMGTSTQTTFIISLLENVGGSLATLPGNFYFTIADLDGQENDEGFEKVSVTGWTSYTLSANSKVERLAPTEEYQFKAQASGTYYDNPSSPCDLTGTQAANSITFLMPATANEFNVSVGVTKGYSSGRNILFGGATTVVCPRSELKDCVARSTLM